jgi:hypothetical protein
MNLYKVGSKKFEPTFFLRLAGFLTLALFLRFADPDAVIVRAQGQKYPPLSEYMMAPDEELALARSAAPEKVSGRATVKILTTTGYKVAAEGDNGFVCMVMRGWAAPSFTPAQQRLLVYDSKLRAPICFDPVASRTVLPLQEFRAKLAMEGKDPDAIGREVAMAYALGKLPKMESVAFGYMWSAGQYLGAEAGAGAPHMMVYAPYYKNSMLGGNEPGLAPFVLDDEGTPFTLIVIHVNGNEAIRPKPIGKQSRKMKQGAKSARSANSAPDNVSRHHR